MHFEEHRIGAFRVYAGAVEAPRGDGYTAALVIERQTAPGQPGTEIFRDEHLACGHRWKTAADAFSYALQKARAAIRQHPENAALC